MADDPYAALGADPYASLGAEPDPYANLGRTDIPRLESQKPTRIIDVLRHPLISGGALGGYLKSRATDAFQHSTVAGGVLGTGSDALIGSILGPDAERRSKEDEMAARPRPAGSALEHVLGFGADVAGSLPSPESWVSLPMKWVGMAGRPILSKVLQRAAEGAVVNTATDPAVQAINLGRGVQDKYNVGQTLIAPAVGAGIGGAFAGAPHLAHGVADLAGAADAAVRGFDVMPTHLPGTKPEPKPQPGAPPTVASLWKMGLDARVGALAPALERQESRGKQGAVSPKGATGVWQLMPDTAEEVAKGLGNPDLAKIAMEDSERGAVANEYLGQVYLSQQLHEFDDPAAALAAYNAGPGRVREWIRKYGHPDQVGRGRWLEMIPFSETRNYVRNILGNTAGGEYKLTPEDYRYMRGRDERFPDEAQVPLPEPKTAAPKPVEVPDAGTYTDEASAHLEAAQRAVEDIFPGDRPASEATHDDSVPWDEEAPSRGDDLTEAALDALRNGKSQRAGEGESLVEALIRKGGLRDDGGELKAMFEDADRRGKMLRRVNTGMDLDSAAQWAQERGYLGDQFDGGERASVNDLLETLRREAGGEKVFASVNEERQALAERMADLEEIMAYTGVHPSTHSNAEIRAAMDKFFADLEAKELVQTEPGELGMSLSGAVSAPTPQQRAYAAGQRILASTKTGTMPGRPKMVAIPGNARDLPKIKNVRDIAHDLTRALDIPHRQGRLGLRKALGTFNRKSGVVRTLQMQEMDVLSHEIAHVLEFTKRYPDVLKALAIHENELRPLAYPGAPKGSLRQEGFAEWFRLYMTNPTLSPEPALGFRTDFEAAMRQDAPREFAAIQKAREDYRSFNTAPSAAVAMATVVRPAARGQIPDFTRLVREEGLVAGAKSAADEAYRATVDFLDPWKRAVDAALEIRERNTGVRDHLRVVDDPYKQMRQFPAIPQAAHADLTLGMHGYHSGTPESVPFTAALEAALGRPGGDLPGVVRAFFGWDEAQIDKFGTWLVARRVLHLYDSIGKPGGLDQPPDGLEREVWEQAFNDLGGEYPEFGGGGHLLNEFMEAFFRKRRDAGLIDQETFEAATLHHPDYVPLFRDVSDKDLTPGSSSSSTKHAGNLIRLKGSNRAYINPLYSIVQMVHQTNALIAHNDAVGAAYRMARDWGPTGSRVLPFEIIPATELKSTEVHLQEAAAAAAKKYGVSKLDATLIHDSLESMFGSDPTANIYRHADTGERGEPIIYYWEDGKRHALRLPDGAWGKHMVEALTGATPQMRNLIVDIAAIPTRTSRAGIITHPAFFFKNPIRDQFEAFIKTDVGYLPIVDWLRGFSHDIRKSEIARLYNVVGGEVGGQVSAGERLVRVNRDLQALRPGASIRNIASWPKFWEGFAHLVEMSETATRLGVFERAYKKFKAEGMDDWAAAKEAAFEARDYMDFDRHGAAETTRVLMRTIPFMNASVQGLDKDVRLLMGTRHIGKIFHTLTGKPPATALEQKEFDHALKAWITWTFMAVGSYALRAYYGDDPVYTEANNQMRDNSWVVKLGPYKLFAIPKPFTNAILSNVAERAYEAIKLKDPTAWDHLLNGLVGPRGLLIPSHEAPIVTIPAGLWSGKDQNGIDIVPENLKGVSAKNQWNDKTSEFSKWLGEHTGLSPMQIDFVIKSMFTSWGRDVLTESDTLVNPDAPIERSATETFTASAFFKDFTRGSNSSTVFWDKMATKKGDFSKAAGDVRLYIMRNDYHGALDALNRMTPQERGFAMAELFMSGQEKQTHPMARAVDAVGQMTQLGADIRKGDVRGEDLTVLPMDAHTRRVAVDTLRRLVAAEQRNALIAIGEPGYVGAKPLPYDAEMLKLHREAPQAYEALQARFKEHGVLPLEDALPLWFDQRPDLERKQTLEDLLPYMDEKRLGGSGGAERALRDVVPAR